ncbi:serine hydrolase [Aliisedimentitalea scapharcae]|uniref:Serine hydrolase n=1 Tax=Aliisedimentitalea scapharcae TaxID=1524259 RepID=A0ABZ2XWG7_9RHOB
MRRFGKWLGRILVLLVLAAALVGFWKREEVNRLLAVNSLFSPEKIVHNFSNMDSAFLSTPVSRGNAPVSPLLQGAEMELPDGVDQWVIDRSVTSMLVMHGGEVRFEAYYLGTNPDDRRISWSIAKSYLSALFGVLLDDGTVTSITDPVTKYAPKLVGSAYDGASIRDVLNMTSGVTFDEDYFDKLSDINRMGYVVALGGTLDDFTASFTDRFADPGKVWEYVSIDTHVLSMVIRGATGRNISDLLAEKIIAPLGLEQDGYYVTDGASVAFVLGGLNFTTRDYARFGQMILQDGQFNGQQIVPADWIRASTTATAPTEPGKLGYGYQWWIPKGAHQGEFMGHGVYGQYLYVDRANDVLIVTTGADRRFRDTGISDKNVEMFRKIAQSL